MGFCEEIVRCKRVPRGFALTPSQVVWGTVNSMAQASTLWGLPHAGGTPLAVVREVKRLASAASLVEELQARTGTVEIDPAKAAMVHRKAKRLPEAFPALSTHSGWRRSICREPSNK